MSTIQLSTDAPESRPSLAGTWRATVLAGIALLTALVGLVLGLQPSPPQVLVGQNIPGSIATFVLALMFTAVGVILRRRRVEHSVGWVLLLFGVAAGATSMVWGVTYVAGLPNGDHELGRTVAWLATALTFPTWTYLATSLIVRFPSGDTETTADARVLRLSAAAGVLAGVVLALRPGAFLIYPSFSNPLRLPPVIASIATVASVLAVIAALVVFGMGALNMVGRYRRAAQVERLQLRWFAFATVLTLTGGAVYTAVGILLAPDNDALRESTYVLFVLSACSLPFAVLQAITRHRLYDIDTIIGRTFAYGALTAILAGLYAASLRLFNALFVAFIGRTDETALVLSTLVLATTFTPIKSRLEKVAERRFRTETHETAAEGAPAGGTTSASGTAIDAAALADLGSRLDTALDAKVEAAVRRAVDQALRERDERGAPGA